jgi:hypothetical protein
VPKSRQNNRTLCANCGQREGTVKWGDALAVTHGFAQMWCEICSYEAQIKHAEERATVLPELRERLAAARARGLNP